jgi:predicted nucleic acid-binding protein
MVDTNVIISALLKPGSVPDIVLNHICEYNELVLCDQIIGECLIVAKRRFPRQAVEIKELFAN